MVTLFLFISLSLIRTCVSTSITSKWSWVYETLYFIAIFELNIILDVVFLLFFFLHSLQIVTFKTNYLHSILGCIKDRNIFEYHCWYFWKWWYTEFRLRWFVVTAFDFLPRTKIVLSQSMILGFAITVKILTSHICTLRHVFWADVSDDTVDDGRQNDVSNVNGRRRRHCEYVT
jgi:hypothetical protein